MANLSNLDYEGTLMDLRKGLQNINSQIGSSYDNGVSRLLDRMGYEPKGSSSNDTLLLVGGIGIGVAIGLGLGVMFAPKRGQELRGDIRHRLDDLKERGTTRYEQMRSHRLEDAAAAAPAEG